LVEASLQIPALPRPFRRILGGRQEGMKWGGEGARGEQDKKGNYTEKKMAPTVKEPTL